MVGVQETYRFTDTWSVAAPVAEVAAVLVDLEHYPQWWPQVRAVAKIGPDTAWVRCRSALPYTLDLVLDAVRREPPVIEVALSGDLDGFARFTLTPIDRAGTAGSGSMEHTRLDFEQEVTVRGWLALASYLGRPLLTWNHTRMMDGCRSGLSC